MSDEQTSSGATGAPMDAERFASYVERRLALHDDEMQVIDRQGMLLRVLARDEEQSVNLVDFFRAYSQNPALLDAVIQTLVRYILRELPVDTGQEFADVADRICLMFKPIELIADVRERGLPMLVYREFLADLIIVYTIDEQRRVSFVNEDHLEAWDISEQELHARALANLRERTANVRYTTVGEGEQRLLIFSSGDGYDASRLLLTDVLDEMARQLPGNLVVGIPNRDFLVAFSDANPDILQAVAAQVQTDSIGQANGLTDQLFTLEKGQIREYEWE